jgi:alpha-D-ribose 1-methylphosphonate 5-triphosphate synthase subunit PhnG
MHQPGTGKGVEHGAEGPLRVVDRIGEAAGERHQSSPRASVGRDRAKARLAAILDALWQQPDRRHAVERALAPVAAREEAEPAARPPGSP